MIRRLLKSDTITLGDDITIRYLGGGKIQVIAPKEMQITHTPAPRKSNGKFARTRKTD